MSYVLKSPNKHYEHRELRPYQQEAFDRFKDRDQAFLAMQMRLGKSLVALRLAEHWKCRRIFIFAPKTTLLSWEEEIDKESGTAQSLVGINNVLRAEVLSAGVDGSYLINYEALLNREVLRAFEKFPPDCIILDESTVVKSARAKVTQAFLRSSDLVDKKICLSGLPTPEDWADIWSQCAILNNGRWMGSSNFWRWLKHHSTKDVYGHFFTPQQGIIIRDEFRKVAYCLSRRDAGLGEQKIYSVRSGELLPSQRKIYRKIVNDWEVPDLEIGPTETNYAMVITGWLRRLCGGYLPEKFVDSWKYAELENILCKELPREKVVVWFAFNDEIKEAFKRLRSKRRCATVAGETSLSERREIIRSFRTKTGTDVLFIQQRLGRFGLDLSVADTAIYFSNSYSLENRAQSEDRIVMPGKSSPLLYIDLITVDTIEEEVRSDLRDKKIDARWLIARTRKMDVDRSGHRRDGMGSMERRKSSRFIIDQAQRKRLAGESRPDRTIIEGSRRGIQNQSILY